MSRFADWDAATWLVACFWCLVVIGGVVWLLEFLGWSGRTERARGKLAYLVGGLASIAAGLIQLGELRPRPERASFEIGFGAFLMAVGLWALLFGPRFDAWRRKRYAARLADRRARREDAYFEELRELEAHPPRAAESSALWQYGLGGLIIILGGGLIAANLNR